MTSKLILEDGSEYKGESFGAPQSIAGEVVFSTGMVGYPESLTDPSYLGQILIFTYPLIGNYGIPEKKYWESDGIKISGLVVSNYIDTPSHFQSKRTLAQWLKDEGIPALEISDTRFLTKHIRTKGTMLGKIIVDPQRTCGEWSRTSRRVDLDFYDPNKENLVAQVSTKKIVISNPYISSYSTPGVDNVQTSGKTVLLYDCGAKANIARCLVKRGVRVITVPWDFDPFKKALHLGGVTSQHLRGVQLDSSEVKSFDGIIISNGPGDPKMADKTINVMQKILDKKIPLLGVCLGHQLLALAAGGDTSKLKFGHRSQNQPCIEQKTKRCFITTQNHGFAVTKIPKGFKPWFTNANDDSNEGIIHKKLPFMSIQFHPEANPGPVDTEWIFDYFLGNLR